MAANEDLEDPWDELADGDEASGDTGVHEERMRINVGKKQDIMRIDKFLMNHVEGATRNKIQQALDEGFILVNGGIVKSNYKIRPLDEIVVFETRKAESGVIVPEEMPLNIVFEDEAVMVINKPAGLVVHPGCGNYTGTLVNGLAWYLGYRDPMETGLPRVGLVHRIDKDTSGLVIIAKTESAMSDLAAQFKNHTVHRRYVALVWGDVSEPEGTVNAHVGRNLRFRKIMDAFPDGLHGKHAITHYSVLERFNYVTLLEMRLETGRTHQIRVHMQHIGHPLFNDSTYGGDYIVKGTIFNKYKQFVENCFKLLPRHALHARELGFTHPVRRERLTFESVLPVDMAAVIEKWRNYSATRTRPFVSEDDLATGT